VRALYKNIPPSPRLPRPYSLTLPKPRCAKTCMLPAFTSRVPSARIREPIPARIRKMYLHMRQGDLSASVGKDATKSTYGAIAAYHLLREAASNHRGRPGCHFNDSRMSQELLVCVSTGALAFLVEVPSTFFSSYRFLLVIDHD
jgi:hypothetical protein